MKFAQLLLLFLLGSSSSVFATVTVTSPKPGSTVTSPVLYAASATAPGCSKGISAFGISVNNKRVYTVSKGSLSTSISLATGAQHTVVQEWDKCGKSTYMNVNLTVVAKPTVKVSASPVTIVSGKSAALTVVATHATTVTVTGSDKTSYTLPGVGGSLSVSPVATTTYTATATGPSGATATAKITVTVTSAPAPTVSISANPTSITSGQSSTLSVSATNAVSVVVTGGASPITLSASGGTQLVTPTATTTYLATATAAGGATATAASTVSVSTGSKALTSVSVTPNSSSFPLGSTQQFSATANYNDGTSLDVTANASWSIANTAVATIDSSGLSTSVASGSTSVTASYNGIPGTAPFSVTIAPGTAVNVPTWHGDTLRTGLNNNEQSLTTNNVSPSTFGKLFSLSVNGYAYAQPLLVSGVTINGATHNVLYVATETNDVYAFDADNFGPPLWHVSTMFSGESPDSVGTSSAIYPTIGITSTPVIDLGTGTMYVVSKQGGNGNGNFFRLSALDIASGAQKLGGPVTITASVPATNGASINGVQTLTTSCIQRSALLLDHENIYFGFGSCHTGWMLAYDKTTLLQSGVFNASTVLDGEGQWASAGGVWMGGGGPASYADSDSGGDGSVFITTGNGPWDGQTAWSDSVLRFAPPPVPTPTSGSAILQPADSFTPKDWHFMFCADADLASGGLLLLPNSTMALAGAKSGWMYLVNSANLGGLQDGDAGAYQTLQFESDLVNSSLKTCNDGLNNTVQWTMNRAPYQVYSTAAYFHGSVYQGITALTSGIPAGIRQFQVDANAKTLTPSTYTANGVEQGIRGTTPFISANGNSNGVVWMIDQNEPLGASGHLPAIATLRAFDPDNLANELYNSTSNAGDAPGYGIKFTSPIVANGKVYISTGTSKETDSPQKGQVDVYGLN